MEQETIKTPSDVATGTGIRFDLAGRNNFDFCRFWLAVMVIFSHSFAVAEGNEHREPLGIATLGQLNSGPFAVSCFFAISGLLIAHSWSRSSSAGAFLEKRIRRIVPGFIVVELIDVFVVGRYASSDSAIPPKGFLSLAGNLLMLRREASPNAFLDNPYPRVINDSLWSIPYEFKSYLLLMVLGLMGLLTTRRRWMPFLFIGIVVGCGLYLRSPIAMLDRGAFARIIGAPSAWGRVLPYFSAGVAVYLSRSTIRVNKWTVGLAVLATLVAARIPPLGQYVFPVTLTYLLFCFAFHPGIPFQGWAKYGDFSYGIYLYAFPIQQLVTMNMPGISPLALFAVATPLSIIAGMASWYLVEARFLPQRRTTHVPAFSGIFSLKGQGSAT